MRAAIFFYCLEVGHWMDDGVLPWLVLMIDSCRYLFLMQR